jgi:hypothetical protein
MPRPKLVLAAVVIALLAVSARPASADITAFLGFTPTTASRAARGLALGGGVMFFGFEFEYSNISEDTQSVEPAPGLKTYSGNVLLQTLPVGGFQLYGTAGGGYATETLGGASHGTFASNLGGGLKFRLIGPLRVRVDYRVLKLTSTMTAPSTRLPTADTYHRFYVGANVAF